MKFRIFQVLYFILLTNPKETLEIKAKPRTPKSYKPKPGQFIIQDQKILELP